MLTRRAFRALAGADLFATEPWYAITPPFWQRRVGRGCTEMLGAAMPGSEISWPWSARKAHAHHAKSMHHQGFGSTAHSVARVPVTLTLQMARDLAHFILHIATLSLASFGPALPKPHASRVAQIIAGRLRCMERRCDQPVPAFIA